MLATIDVVTSPPPVSQTDAQRAAYAYGMAHLAPTFECRRNRMAGINFRQIRNTLIIMRPCSGNLMAI